jgi:branched-chain amino acid transport system permease protein
MSSYIMLQAANGLVVGLIYALAAAGLTLIFSVLKVVNFGHGVLYMLGGYTAFYAIKTINLPPALAVLAAMLALFVFGFLFERLLITPLYTSKVERKDEYAIIVTFGLFMLVENLAIVLFGPFNRSAPPFARGAFHIGVLAFTYDRLIAAGASILLLSALSLFMTRTMLGRVLDAVSQSREAAAIIGVDAKRYYALAFGIGAALAGGAGALIGPIFTLTPTMGDLPSVKSFIIIVLGGMGSVPGSIVGGILIGLVEGLGVALYPNADKALAYSSAFSALLLALTLLFRPTGLFGRRHTRLE